MTAIVFANYYKACRSASHYNRTDSFRWPPVGETLQAVFICNSLANLTVCPSSRGKGAPAARPPLVGVFEIL